MAVKKSVKLLFLVANDLAYAWLSDNPLSLITQITDPMCVIEL
jgi:hypothetical protein